VPREGIDGSSLVQVANTNFTALLGGVFDCSLVAPSSPTVVTKSTFSVTGVDVRSVWGFQLQGATIKHCGEGTNLSTANIRIRGNDGFAESFEYPAELKGNVIEGRQRAFWTETVSKVLFHDNTVNTFVGLDLDGYSGQIIAYNNRIENTFAEPGNYGIWMEEGCNGVIAFNNVISGHLVGLYMYNGAASRQNGNHILVGNKIRHTRQCVSFGSNQARAAPSSHSIIASNECETEMGITNQAVAVAETLWDNSFSFVGKPYGLAQAYGFINPQKSSLVTAFDPATYALDK